MVLRIEKNLSKTQMLVSHVRPRYNGIGYSQTNLPHPKYLMAKNDSYEEKKIILQFKFIGYTK